MTIAMAKCMYRRHSNGLPMPADMDEAGEMLQEDGAAQEMKRKGARGGRRRKA